MNEQVIKVSVREYFGRITVRPECPASRLFAELLGQKNLTQENIEVIRRLGYRIEVKEIEL